MPSNHPFNIEKNLKESKPFLCMYEYVWVSMIVELQTV